MIQRILIPILLMMLCGTHIHEGNEAKRQLLFIVNPISHQLRGRDIEAIIERNLDPRLYSYDIVYTRYPQHAGELAREALDRHVDIVVAVGGDGTVNEVAAALVHSETALAIVPAGSGNGLARHLNIPMDLNDAVALLNRSRSMHIDSATLNDRIFLCTAGCGFDAHVAEQFSRYGKRGLASYVKVGVREYRGYSSKCYSFVVDGKSYQRDAFILTIANSAQYGNNAMIAPHASVEDGQLDIVVIKPMPWPTLISFLCRLKTGTLRSSKYVEVFTGKEVVVANPKLMHLDGEPLKVEDEARISIKPASLTVMVPA